MIFCYNFLIILLVNISVLVSSSSPGTIDPREIRCLICKITVHEIENEISKMDPDKIAEVSGFRIDANGNSVTKTVKYSKSEMYLTDVMENICEKMDDYAKATHKKTNKLNCIKMVGDDGKMNPDISSYDFIQDGDLNKSLKHYCLEILDDHDELFLEAFMKENLESDLDIKICSQKAKYCNEAPLEEEYKLEDEL